MLNWFAVYVQSRHEKVAALALSLKGFETCLPLVRRPGKKSNFRTVVEEAVFPGYVFCKFDSAVRTPILRTPGIVRIIAFGKDPVPIRPEEVSALQVLEQAKVAIEPWPYLEKGQWVCIEDGPLAGMSGIVTDCKKGPRVVISVSLLQRSVAVEVSRWHIRPANSPAPSVAPSAVPLRRVEGFGIGPLLSGGF